MNITNTKKLTLTGVLIAFGVILPLILHSIPNAGSIFLPMHIPVFICALCLGAPYGVACGLLSVILSSLLTGMPPALMVPSMITELLAYALVASFVLKHIHAKNELVTMYIALVSSMLIGRVVMGLANAFLFFRGAYGIAAFVSGAFIVSLPGIILQLLFLPSVALVIKKHFLKIQN